MVIEISKEIDVVRIGIDRYSLKTGLNLKTVMDVSLRVIKEPRGFIRVIQCIMAILAFSTTAGFSTDYEFSILCSDGNEKVGYDVSYPFSHSTLEVFPSCSDKEEHEMTLPFDYSNPAEFFVATGVISFLYTLIILVVYICFHQAYANNPRIPVVDLGMSAVLSIFWLAGSSAWAQGVADLKHYLQPSVVFSLVNVCITPKNSNGCEVEDEGSYGTLNGSLVLGFANFLLWVCSLWFVYKETVFHMSEPVEETNQNTASKGVGKV